MIDCHSHIFNLAYVPVRGLLEAWSVPPALAGPAARVLDRLTRVDELPETYLDIAVRGALASSIEVATADLVLDIARAVAADELAAMRGDIAAGVAYLDSLDDGAAGGELDVAVLIEADVLATDREGLSRILRAVARFVDGAEDTLRWLLLMLNRESILVDRLLELWDGEPLHVHHMMDMDPHYPPGRSRFRFVEEQIPRVQRIAARHPDRLRTFVAYGPFREDALEIVRRALAEYGCAGVKFYPPSGYKPIDNRDEDLEGATATDVNRRNLELYALCVERDTPLFAHCSPGGLEQRPGTTGTYSDPRLWRRVLEAPGLSHLRLCLAHAGGCEGWVAPHSGDGDAEFERSYASEVVELCARFPNVYCEFGHFECVLRDDLRSKFQRRLERVIEARGATFGRKLMFGSDWHPVARVPHHRELVRVWRAMLRSSDVLAPYEHAFFTDNASAYLKLPARVTPGESLGRPANEHSLRSSR